MLDTQEGKDPVSRRNRLIIAVLWCMGLRSMELLELRWGDIDLEEGTLLVRVGKGNKQRQLYFNDHLLQDMREYRAGIVTNSA